MNRRVIHGPALQLLRVARGKSQAETAAIINLHADGLGLIERMQRDITLHQFLGIAHFLRYDPHAFILLTSPDPAKVLACLLPEEEKKDDKGEPLPTVPPKKKG